MPIRDTEPAPSDTCETILQKIDRASRAEKANIKWRQCVYIAIGISLALFLLIVSPGKLPNWPVFYSSVIIIFAIQYTHMNWYSYHRYLYAERNIRQNVEKLSKFCKYWSK